MGDMVLRALIPALLIALTGAGPAHARLESQTQICAGFSGLPVPRFVSLRYDEAIGRSGPSRQHPELYLYRRAGLPLQIIQETPDWRKVRDPGGVEVWMHRRLLSGRRAVWAREAADLRARPDEESSLIARIEPEARLWLERCRTGWCRLEAGGRRGWAQAGLFWGVTPADQGAGAGADGALEGALAPCYRSEPEPAGLAAVQ
ncbi:MAG: SH3 domain-containing protein [Oceanicaulis sp.]